jgi:hypothetical protein
MNRILSLFVIALTANLAHAQNDSAGELTRRNMERRAVEAVIWGMPAVNTDLMLQAALNQAKARINQFVYWSRPVDWKNQTLTPNPDAIYLMTFFDTKDVGPIVIEVPPADGGSFAANIVNLWQAPLEDAGPEGADKGKGGKYLILPPNHKEKVPDGHIVLRSDTNTGYALFRSNLPSHSDADIQKAAAYGKRLKIYPLSQAARPPETTFTDAFGVMFDATIPYDARFFDSLNRIVQSDPWLERDRAMIDRLKSLGIEKGKPFNPDATTKAALDAGAREAHAWLEDRYNGDVLGPYFPGSHWRAPVTAAVKQSQEDSWTTPDSYPVDDRGLTYTYGYIGIKHLGAAQFYMMTIKDKTGEAYDGGSSYRLTVPANAPVKQYWSMTVYDRETHALVRDMRKASVASNSTAVKKNADGSVDVYFGPSAPAGKEANWVPTKPAAQFEILARFYGPQKPLFEKTWALPDIEKMQ